MRLRKMIVVGILATGGAIAAVIASNPLRRSEEGIGAWLQPQTPIGSPRSAVVAYAEKKKWFDPRAQGSDGRTHGEYVRGELGHYRTILDTSVTVFWEFDSASRLERIRVWKTVDGP